MNPELHKPNYYYPYYPLVYHKSNRKEGRIEYCWQTSIRLKYKGKWYLSPISEHFSHPEDLAIRDVLEGKITSMARFYKNVYESYLLTKINKDMINAGIFTLDINQESEVERVSKTRNFFNTGRKVSQIGK